MDSSNSTDTTQASSTNSFQIASHKKYVLTSEWKVYKRRIERIARPSALRYGKLTTLQIDQLIRTALRDEDIDEEDVYYRRANVKIRTNLSTWKHRTLNNMKVK